MYRIFYAERDTTIYERYPKQNTGIDQILELTKIASGSKLNGIIQNNTYNSRFLIDFGSGINTISSSILAGDIPDIVLGHPASASAYLVLRAADATDLLHSYTIKAYPVSQSFTNESPDIRMNVTDIVQHWLSGSIDNNGFMIKRTTSDETSGEVMGKLQFFGRETHTIFQPRLEILWDNTTSGSEALATEITGDTIVPYVKNIKSEYRTSEIAKFRVGVRPEFPTKTYQTASFYLTGERLPTSSYYSILDSVTNETIMPFDITGSRIDHDANGSFFKLRMDSFMPERYYKIMLKVERDGGDDIQTFDDFYFKVVN